MIYLLPHLLVAGGFLVGRLLKLSFLASIPFSIVVLVPIVSVSRGLAIATRQTDLFEAIVLICFIIIGALGLAHSLRLGTTVRNLFGSLSGALILGGSSFLIDYLVKQHRLATIAFGDVETLLMMTESFQKFLNLSATDWHLSLKRGVGLSNLGALAESGEYWAGLMTFSFLAFMISLAGIMFRTLGRITISSSVLVVGFLLLVISSEAILRFAFLYHSIILTVLGVSFLILLLQEKKIFDAGSLVAPSLVLSSFVFLRVDNLLVLMPMLLVFVSLVAKDTKILRIVVLLAFLVPAPSLVLLYRVPAPPWFWVALIIGSTAVVLISLLLNHRFIDLWQKSPSLIGVLFAASLVIAIFFGALASPRRISESFQSWMVNLFLGEGLWGGLGIGLVALIAYSLVSRRRREYFPIIAIIIGTLGAMTFAKFGDAVNQGIDFGFARIGWGDSLNRMVTYLLPLFGILVGRIVDGLSLNSGNEAKNNNRK